MSNEAILAGIEARLAQVERAELPVHELVPFLHASAEALEGVTWRVIQEGRDIEVRLTISPFADQDEDFPTLAQAAQNLRDWIEKVRKETCQHARGG